MLYSWNSIQRNDDQAQIIMLNREVRKIEKGIFQSFEIKN